MDGAGEAVGTTGPEASAVPGQRDGRAPGSSRRRWPSAAVPLGYLAVSVWLYFSLWLAPDRRYLPDSMQDQDQWQWFFAVVADNVRHLRNPMFTHLQNAPDGVNLMANTGMPGLSVPLAPLTWWLGPSTVWVLVLTLGLAGTAWSWYRLMRRHLGMSRLAGGLAGGLCGFAPPVVSHANAHPNLIVLFVLPFLIGRVLMVCRGEGGAARNGAVLGLLAAYQLLMGEEALLITAVGLALFLVAYALFRRSEAKAAARRIAIGGGVALCVCLPLAAFPLIWQFTGPQSYSGLPHGPQGNDVEALVSYARRSLAGHAEVSAKLSANPTEENAFLGWPLVLLGAAVVVWLRREAAARALALTAVVAAVLSLGPTVRIGQHDTGIPGPWRLIGRLPLLDSILESRMTMICFPAAAVLIGLATDRVRRAAPAADGVPVRLVWGAAAAMALLPLFPTPYPVVHREAVPAFFTDGTWRQYVRPGRTLVPAPLPSPGGATALHWQVEAGLGFALPEGYFVGPHGPDRIGGYGAAKLPTSLLLDRVAGSGKPAAATPPLRAQARHDLAHWKADAVVLAPRANDAALRQTLDGLLGPGAQVDGVWVWKAR